jgi:hypothetical protein
MKTIHGVKACDIDSFHSGQCFNSSQTLVFTFSADSKRSLGTNSFLVARRNGEVLPYFQIEFHSRVQKGEIRRGCGQEIPRKMSVWWSLYECFDKRILTQHIGPRRTADVVRANRVRRGESLCKPWTKPIVSALVENL